jgi:ABC-2 type transport system permease protein
VRCRRVRGLALATLVVAVIAGAAGASSHSSRSAAHEALTGFGDSGFTAQSAEHPHAIAHRGYVVSRPPPPLGFLDGGLDRALGIWLRLDAHQTQGLQGARTADLVRAPGAGRFDLGLFFVLIAPAFIIALGYDRIAAEKRRGTFSMLRASGLRPGPWVCAKAVGLGARVGLAILIPASLVAFVITLVQAPEEAPRLLVWLAIQSLALATWGGLVLSISAVARSPQSALGLGLLSWAMLALVVPPAASATARVFADPPPPATLAAQLATWAESAHAQSEQLRSRALKDIRRRHPEWDGEGQTPEIVDAVMLRLADRQVSKQMRRLLHQVEMEQDREGSFAARLSFASPSGLAMLAGGAIAGSDLAHGRHARNHFERYRQTLMAWINDWWAKNGTGGFDSFDLENRLKDLSDAPRPTAPNAPAQLAWRGARLPIALMGGLFMLTLLVFYGVSRRQLGAEA